MHTSEATSGRCSAPPGSVWRGLGDGNFVPITTSGLEFKQEGRALVTLDHDRDGDLDVVIGGNQQHHLRLFRSQAVQKGKRWLRVELDTSGAPQLAPNGIGSRVRIAAGGQVMYRTQTGACNFGGQSELALYFGLGDHQLVDELEVRWADASTTLLRDVPTSQALVLQAP